MRILMLVFIFSFLAQGIARAQDAAAGEVVFSKQCKDCHHIGEGISDKRGPVLNGLFGRKAGSIPGYDYSDANRNSTVIWDEKTLREYVRDPHAVIPGTRKRFIGLTDEQNIEDLITYLKQFDAFEKQR